MNAQYNDTKKIFITKHLTNYFFSFKMRNINCNTFLRTYIFNFIIGLNMQSRTQQFALTQAASMRTGHAFVCAGRDFVVAGIKGSIGNNDTQWKCGKGFGNSGDGWKE